MTEERERLEERKEGRKRPETLYTFRKMTGRRDDEEEEREKRGGSGGREKKVKA